MPVGLSERTRWPASYWLSVVAACGGVESAGHASSNGGVRQRYLTVLISMMLTMPCAFGCSSDQGSASAGTDAAAGAGSGTGGSSGGRTIACGATRCVVSTQVCCRDKATATNACVARADCPEAPGRAVLECDSSIPSTSGASYSCCFDTTTRNTARAGPEDGCGQSHLMPTITVRLCDPAANDCGSLSCQPATFDGWLPSGYYACQ